MGKLNQKQLIAQSILDRAWELLKEFEDDSPTLYSSNHEISYLNIGEEVTEPKAKEYLIKQITESLDTKGMVFLYTCRDNACIVIFQIAKEDTWEALETFEQDADIPQLFIVFD